MDFVLKIMDYNKTRRLQHRQPAVSTKPTIFSLKSVIFGRIWSEFGSILRRNLADLAGSEQVKKTGASGQVHFYNKIEDSSIEIEGSSMENEAILLLEKVDI